MSNQPQATSSSPRKRKRTHEDTGAPVDLAPGKMKEARLHLNRLTEEVKGIEDTRKLARILEHITALENIFGTIKKLSFSLATDNDLKNMGVRQRALNLHRHIIAENMSPEVVVESLRLRERIEEVFELVNIKVSIKCFEETF